MQDITRNHKAQLITYLVIAIMLPWFTLIFIPAFWEGGLPFILVNQWHVIAAAIFISIALYHSYFQLSEILRDYVSSGKLRYVLRCLLQAFLIVTALAFILALLRWHIELSIMKEHNQYDGNRHRFADIPHHIIQPEINPDYL